MRHGAGSLHGRLLRGGAVGGRAPHVSLVQHPESPSEFSATHLGQKKGLAVPFLKLLVPSHLSCPNKLGTIFKNTSESKTKKIFLLLFLTTILAKGMSIYWALQFRKSGMRWDTCSHPRLLAHTDYSQRTRVLSHITGVCLLVSLWTTAHQAPLSGDCPGKNTGGACCALL